MRHTFKVRKTKSDDTVDFTVDMPATITDTDMIAKRFGTVTRMIDRANAQWTVDVAVGVRKRLPNVQAATRYAEQYCDDGRKDSHVPTIDREAAVAIGFTDEQLAFAAAAGMKIA